MSGGYYICVPVPHTAARAGTVRGKRRRDAAENYIKLIEEMGGFTETLQEVVVVENDALPRFIVEVEKAYRVGEFRGPGA